MNRVRRRAKPPSASLAELVPGRRLDSSAQQPMKLLPTLDQLAEQPELAAGVPAYAARELTVRCLIVLAALAPVQFSLEKVPVKLLSLEEAAATLCMPLSTLRARANLEPYRSLRGSNGTRYVCFRSDLVEAFIEGKTLGPRAGLPPSARRKPTAGGPSTLQLRREEGGAGS
jgi:hypothetical protein